METGLIILGAFALLFGGFSIYLGIKYMQLQNSMNGYRSLCKLSDENNIELKAQLQELDAKYVDVANKLGKTVHQKKSSEVRLGKVGENLAPFTDNWPWDPNNFRFIGSPVDGMQFTEDMIYIVEIKTGNSRLSKYQAKCRDLIKAGKISFVTYRIGEEGTKITEFPIEKELIK